MILMFDFCDSFNDSFEMRQFNFIVHSAECESVCEGDRHNTQHTPTQSTTQQHNTRINGRQGAVMTTWYNIFMLICSLHVNNKQGVASLIMTDNDELLTEGQDIYIYIYI